MEAGSDSNGLFFPVAHATLCTLYRYLRDRVASVVLKPKYVKFCCDDNTSK